MVFFYATEVKLMYSSWVGSVFCRVSLARVLGNTQPFTLGSTGLGAPFELIRGGLGDCSSDCWWLGKSVLKWQAGDSPGIAWAVDAWKTGTGDFARLLLGVIRCWTSSRSLVLGSLIVCNRPRRDDATAPVLFKRVFLWVLAPFPGDL